MESLIGRETKILYMADQTVLPGFIDARIHVLSSGTRHVMAADCALPTTGDIQAALRERIAVAQAGQWDQGFKFDDTKTAENWFLHREDLDAISTEHPSSLPTGLGMVISATPWRWNGADSTTHLRTRRAGDWAATPIPAAWMA